MGDDRPQYEIDAAKALNRASATGDQKMAEDVLAAFDRHTDLERARRDMDTKP